MIIKQSPLKGINVGTVTMVSIAEIPGLYTTDLRVAPETSTHAAVIEALGMELPGKPGETQTATIPGGGEAHALCLAPDWWLIVGYQEAEQKLSPLRLNNDYHFSVTDVSGQRTTIELEGPNAREVLAHLWEQDLREKYFPVSSVSQGLTAKAPVIVWHMAPFRYRVMVRSSFALHLWKALADAAGEWILA
ncbi:sarcosine oxidase subunit gamma family protein [Ferruginibacter paludis]|uniref:sarcosine oxidase subunit gamma n=1 Tax=Ferruginibacter paludis TaxID=1310417 RepID=UPI0025B4A06B|nr:sarcosine oxidase subunit gamma family protein [Ferruginibacter paludis]MDN3655581.1 sarcosine oxidase subunit gamma family protein [Ferruginibacter paludis]